MRLYTGGGVRGRIAMQHSYAADRTDPRVRPYEVVGGGDGEGWV